MKLTTPQALDLVTAPKNRKQIDAARRAESQLRVFTEELSYDELFGENYWQDFATTVKTRLDQKTDRVLQFFRYPLPVIQITDSILSDYLKVFDGKNRNFKINADRDISRLNAWVSEINLEAWIEESARKVYKNQPCSFVVIDKDSKGKEYPILVCSNRLIDAQFSQKSGQLEYIVFVHSETETHKNIAVYDASAYRVFANEKNTDTYSVIVDQAHNIGYCPAHAFVIEPSNDKNPFKRRVAFTQSVASLEDWTLFDAFRNFTDHYAPFPVMEGPENKCANDNCKKGWVIEEVALENNPDAAPVVKYHKCPVCEGKKGNFIGPGTYIGINVASEKDRKDGSGIFRMILPATADLKYTPEKLDDLEVDIRHKIVGVNNLESMNEAMNELQTKGSFASMETVLLRTKRQLDAIYKWMAETAGRSMYTNISLKVDANFGTEFYLTTEADLQKRYKDGKAMGLPIEELLMIYTQLIETKYKGNPSKIERQKMLLELDPYPLYTVSEIISLAEKNLIDRTTLVLKINFLNFVARFEAENMPITQFGLLLKPDQRLRAIRATFDRYASELKLTEQKTLEKPAQT